MKHSEVRLVCFGSGDFPVKTFEALTNLYNVVGFVTSNDKATFGDKRVYDIAKENDIPVYIPKSLEDKDFLDWLDKVNGNTYCVISYKFLPKCVLEKAEHSFNVHASILPLLRGAAPINWAIRYGLRRTGLTAIELSDKIDCGDIIASVDTEISDDDNFKTLFEKLSEMCIVITVNTIHKVNENSDTVRQPIIPKRLDSKLFHAPKLTKENTTFVYYDNLDATAKDIHNMIRSLSPNIGTTFNMSITKYEENPQFLGDLVNVKTITFKVYESELVNKGVEWIESNYTGSDIVTDWKNYMYILAPKNSDDVVSIKRIQIPGKKILDIKEFLKGFQVYNNPEYNYSLN